MPCGVARRQGGLQHLRHRLHRRVGGIVDSVAYFGTFDNQVIALDLAKRAVRWRYEHPDRKFPFYSSAAVVDGRSCSAAAIGWCTRSTRRPASRSGPT